MSTSSLRPSVALFAWIPFLCSAPASASDTLRAERDVPRPERVHEVPAEYPQLLRGALPVVVGIVVVEVELDEQGQPSGIKILRGIPVLDRAVVDAVMQWRFDKQLPPSERETRW